MTEKQRRTVKDRVLNSGSLPLLPRNCATTIRGCAARNDTFSEKRIRRDAAAGFLALVLMLSPLYVTADNLDHSCLKACVANGTAKSACMDQCRYANAESGNSRKSKTATLSPHRVLNAPVPMDQASIAPQRAARSSTGAGASNKNQVCAQNCLGQGYSSGYCRERCAKESCPSTAVLCSSSGGGIKP